MHKYSVVWFKRDLRIHDHQPLSIAAHNSDFILPIYIFEPEYWQLKDTSARHCSFILQSLQELHRALKTLGQGLLLLEGDAVEQISALREKYPFTAIYSHEETGNLWTYQRDEKVRDYCKYSNILFSEHPQFAVIRGNLNRDNYSQLSRPLVERELIKAPDTLKSIIKTPDALVVNGVPMEPVSQSPGRRAAVKSLKEFIYKKSQYYRGNISSPIKAKNACSRLSPYLSYGCISMSEVFHAINLKTDMINQLNEQPASDYWLKSLDSFKSRLYWHCHFIQKLESQPDIEYKNLMPAMDGLREEDFNETIYQAWATGNTGYPFIDACMRSLIKTGWINFRMRALLISFATFHCWLHWKKPAEHLARIFIDYEPGIHYSQIQMQAGTAGINALRVYNPVKQGLDQDGDGSFVRKWVPELAQLDSKIIHTPWLFENKLNYPPPIIEHISAAKRAKDIVYGVRKTDMAKKQSNSIFKKHGSRKKRKKPQKKENPDQQSMDFS